MTLNDLTTPLYYGTEVTITEYDNGETETLFHGNADEIPYRLLKYDVDMIYAYKENAMTIEVSF